MDKQQHSEETATNSVTYFYSPYLRHTIFSFLLKILQFSRGASATAFRRKACLPLPLPSNIISSNCLADTEATWTYHVLGDVVGRLFTNLQNIETNLQFWQAMEEETCLRRIGFMVFERGPRAFLVGVLQLLRECFISGFSIHHLHRYASTHIAERRYVLSSLRYALAIFLAKVYIEVDMCGEDLMMNPEKVFLPLLITINRFFSEFNSNLLGSQQANSSFCASYCFSVTFEDLAVVNQDHYPPSDICKSEAINTIHRNLERLETYLHTLVAVCKKPNKLRQYWIRYTVGAISLSFCSIWLLQHSRIMGSSDIDNWVLKAKNTMSKFYSDHVERPLISIRDELFKTFRKGHKGVMDVEEVELTAHSLHRMLVSFSEQMDSKLSKHASDQEMLELVMARYEKELMHPLQNLLSGEIARALLIQVQKLKLDIETAMLELDQILDANEINFAILAAVPAFILSFILLASLRAWLHQDTRAEGRGRLAQRRRRLLLVEIEKRIMHYQTYSDVGKEKEALFMYGLALCTLDRLYHAVELHAKSSDEWPCLKQDISDLAKPSFQTGYKLVMTSHMLQTYECLLPDRATTI